MATSVRFEILQDPKQEPHSSPVTHSYALRSRTAQSDSGDPGVVKRSGSEPEAKVKGVRRRPRVSKLGKVLRRRSRVKRGVCGDVKVKSTRKKVMLKPSAIQQKDVVIPPKDPTSSPTHIVIKTNPLFDSTSPSSENRGQRSGVAGQEVFYGQRRKIRKTKEQEMISVIMDVTNHSKKKTSLLQKMRNLGTKRGTSKITGKQRKGRGKAIRPPLTLKNRHTELYHMLTQV